MSNNSDRNSKKYPSPGQPRKPYVTPQLEVLGSVISQTKAGGSDAMDGDFTDQS